MIPLDLLYFIAGVTLIVFGIMLGQIAAENSWRNPGRKARQK